MAKFDWQTVIFAGHYGANKLNFTVNGANMYLAPNSI